MTRTIKARVAWVAMLLLPSAAIAAEPGVQVSLSGGVISFPGELDLNPGGAYGVNVALHPVGLFGLELGYQGAAYSEDAPGDGGLAVDAVENGGSALLMVSPLAGVAQPYVLSGVKLSHLNAIDPPTLGGALQDDTLTKVPLGGGIDFAVESFTIGLRATYDFVFRDNEAFQDKPSPRSADQIFTTMNVGAQF